MAGEAKYRGRRALLFGLPLVAIARAEAAAQPHVVATFSVLGDMVRRIAGERVALTTIVGPDGDSETYAANAEDARAIAEADFLVMNGLNPQFEPWLGALMMQAEVHGMRCVASEGASRLKKTDEADTAVGGHPGEVDQHAWHDVANGAICAENIAAALIALDPARADEVRARADAYHRELLELDAWARRRIAEVPAAKRTAITAHNGFAYLARAYGVTIIGVRGWTNAEAASASRVAGLVQRIRDEGLRAIFIENTNDPRLIRRMAREAGATVGGMLYSDALSQVHANGGTYVTMVKHNIATLCAGMLRNRGTAGGHRSRDRGLSAPDAGARLGANAAENNNYVDDAG
jgi:zinc/manganese transport system substrate-binding protein